MGVQADTENELSVKSIRAYRCNDLHSDIRQAGDPKDLSLRVARSLRPWMALPSQDVSLARE
jgi:hypothetical protein